MSSVRPEPLSEGRFQLIEVIGEGGMATVYRAFDQRLQRPRAIKVLSPALAIRPQLRRRFLAEAQTMATLEESRVVRVFDMGEDGDRVFIVMELVEGGSLLDRVRNHGPLPARMAAEVTADLCESLQAAHDAGVIHRDIKPHNVLLTRSGAIRITDFGIAQVQHEGDAGMTKTGAVLGTWGFMAPEQKSNAKTVDARADVYSAGATLWSLLKNEVPPELFMADNEPEMLIGIEPDLAEVIKRATRYRREERYPTSKAMAQALRELAPSLPDDPPEVQPLVPLNSSPSTNANPIDTMMHFQTNPPDADAPRPPLDDGTMVPDMADGEDEDEPVATKTRPESLRKPKRGPSSFTVSEDAPERPRRGGFRWWMAGIPLVGIVLSLVTVISFWPDAPDPVVQTPTDKPVPPVQPPPIVTPPDVVAVPPDPVADPSGTTNPPVVPDPKTTTNPKHTNDHVVTPNHTETVVTPAVVDPIPPVAPVVRTPPPDPPPVKSGPFSYIAPDAATVGQSATFTVSFSGNHTMKLYYKAAGGGAFKEKDLRLADGAYVASVKIDESMLGGLDYYIAEVDGSSKVAKAGSGFKPLRVAVSP